MVSAAIVYMGTAAVIVHLGLIILQHAALGAITTRKVLQVGVINIRDMIYDIVIVIACVIELG